MSLMKCQNCCDDLNYTDHADYQDNWYQIKPCSNCLELARLDGYTNGLKDALKTVETGGN